MDLIKCPKCDSKVLIDIAKAVDENAEVYKCYNCRYLFRYVNK